MAPVPPMRIACQPDAPASCALRARRRPLSSHYLRIPIVLRVHRAHHVRMCSRAVRVGGECGVYGVSENVSVECEHGAEVRKGRYTVAQQRNADSSHHFIPDPQRHAFWLRHFASNSYRHGCSSCSTSRLICERTPSSQKSFTHAPALYRSSRHAAGLWYKGGAGFSHLFSSISRKRDPASR